MSRFNHRLHGFNGLCLQTTSTISMCGNNDVYFCDITDVMFNLIKRE